MMAHPLYSAPTYRLVSSKFLVLSFLVVSMWEFKEKGYMWATSIGPPVFSVAHLSHLGMMNMSTCTPYDTGQNLAFRGLRLTLKALNAVGGFHLDRRHLITERNQGAAL